MLSAEGEEVFLYSHVEQLNQPWLTDATVISLSHSTLNALK